MSKGRTYSGLWPKEIADYVETNAAGISQSEMLLRIYDNFGVIYTKQQIASYYKNHNLRTGLNHTFKPGMPSPMKGRKMSPETYEKCKKTMFKKGHDTYNKAKVGDEIIDAEGYHETKVANPDVWEFTHRVVYEKEHGSLPKGMMIIFRDGNKDNLDPDNLVAVTRAENIYINQNKLRSNDPEKTDAAIKLAKIKAKIRELKQ